MKQAERRAASTHVDEEGKMWVELPSNFDDAQKYREQARAVIEGALDPGRAEIAFHYLRHDNFLKARIDPVRFWLTEPNEEYPRGRGIIVTIRKARLQDRRYWKVPEFLISGLAICSRVAVDSLHFTCSFVALVPPKL